MERRDAARYDRRVTDPVSRLVVKKGEVHVLYAYDIGLSIDLAVAKQRLTAQTELATIRHKGHAPRYFQFDPAPLRITQEAGAFVLGRFELHAAIEIVLYDFGGVSVAYELPFRGPLEDLVDLSCELSASTALREDSFARVQQLLAIIASSVANAQIAPLTEDYLIFLVDTFAPPITPAQLAQEHAQCIARILRAERDLLSEQEVSEATGTRVTFGLDDVAIVDWNAALVFDRESEDVRAVLEFANLQLLELRYIDEQLDATLDRAYELIGRRGGLRHLRLPGETRAALRHVARLQVDSAILFERVNNALKLLGDQYLARVYRATSQRYRLNEWNTSLLRKLETIETIYDKVHDQSVGFRMEVLEWIIVFLIALEIVLSFVAH